MEQYQRVRLPDGSTGLRENPSWKNFRQRKKYKEYLKRSNIPKEYWKLNFNSFPWDKSKDSVDKCRKYGEGITEEKFQDISLFLHGPNSTGKTTAMCAIGKLALWKGLKVKYELSGNLHPHLMKYHSYDNEESKEIKKQLSRYDLILIDEAFDPDKITTWTNNKSLASSAWDVFVRDFINMEKDLSSAVSKNE